MRILCLGDSNTYGYDPRSYLSDRYPTEDRWPDLLAMQTGHTIINAGVNGRTVPSPILHTPAEYPQADLLLILLGTNDLLEGASAKDTARKMEAFIESILPRYNRILLMAPPSMKRAAWVSSDSLVQESVKLGREYLQLAQKLGIFFVDSRYWNIDLTYDGVHFSEAGHHSFAKMLTQEFLSHHIDTWEAIT